MTSTKTIENPITVPPKTKIQGSRWGGEVADGGGEDSNEGQKDLTQGLIAVPLSIRLMLTEYLSWKEGDCLCASMYTGVHRLFYCSCACLFFFFKYIFCKLPLSLSNRFDWFQFIPKLKFCLLTLS